MKAFVRNLFSNGAQMERPSLIPQSGSFTFQSTATEQIRLDKFMAHQFPAYSRTFLQELIAKESVTINGVKIGKASTLIKLKDTVQVHFPNTSHQKKETSHHDFGVTIIKQAEHFLIINKPAGLIVHSSTTQSTEPTLVDWIEQHCEDIKQVGMVDRPGIVHRLDKDTSGIMILARTNYAQQNFTQQFKDRTMSKTYHAIVEGSPQAQGVVDAPIGRHPVKRHKMAAFKAADQIRSSDIRSAVTQYKVLEYYQDSALVELKPVTGRTHQIRVHMASIGHPLLGDQTYGKKSKLIARHALHAYAIAFTFDNEPFSLDSEWPEDFSQAIQLLRNIQD